MSTTAQQAATAVPTGVWQADPVHSAFEFSVKHMVVATFRGSLPDFEATLTGAEDGTATLEAVGRVASIVTQDENLTGHLQSPDFFDAQRHPEATYRGTEVVRDGDALTVRGELTLKGVTRPLELRGTIAGPVVGLGDAEVIAVELEGQIDRTEYGLNWNAPLPGGGFVLSNTVTMTARLEMRRAQ
ncbi:YceI family protein [Miltoncostaea marina]|uniref:YceI family protein n=1 Tax=Miltoncostaea marina TaxID=2843215 RepID=UPI001C3C2ABC|nr:YceI family protein [Miltoncostaea marina]